MHHLWCLERRPFFRSCTAIRSHDDSDFWIIFCWNTRNTKILLSRQYFEGKVVSVMCLAISDTKPLQFRWDKNGKVLENGKHNVRIENSSEFSVLILDVVSSESEGNYTCTATNSVGSTTHSAHLNVKAPPKWIETPEDMIKAIGEPAFLKCLASGSPRPKVSFRKYLGADLKRTNLLPNSGFVFDEQDSTFKIQSLSYEDAGLYECFATNSVEPNISANFSITIRGFSPLNIIVKTILLLSAKMAVPFICIYLLFGLVISSLSEESGNIRLKSSNEFSIIIIDPVDLLSEGNYTCKAADSKSEASHSTQLQVDAPSTWLEETKDVTVALGSAVTIYCRAHGSPKPEIQLRKVPGHSSAHVVQDSKFTSKNGTFLFMQISSEDSGMYVCEANNGVASPKIQPFNFKNGIRQGDKTTTLCVAESKSPLTYSWKKDGELLMEKEELRLKTDEEFSVIIIEPVKMEHSGNYTCIAKTIKDLIVTLQSLLLKLHQFGRLNPKMLQPYLKHDILFKCSAFGSPTPVITWKKMSETSELKEIVVGNGETLVFESLKITDAGVYVCEANNGVGPLLKKFVVLGIRDSPKIPPIVFPPNVRVGLPTKAFCTIEKGSKPLQFSWSFGGKEIQDSDSAVLIDKHEDYSVLNINPVSSKHTGNYTCTVQNLHGRDSYTAALIVHEPTTWIKEPDDVEVLEGYSVSLPCLVSGLPKPNIRWYKYNSAQVSAQK
ncbi:hemicentin-1 [Caerostris extrusa]|uniref:Hemicentin-1 n=1 Tax=Caerostris extrusa TaxID=172846 RepID=A0AAV4QNC9_CAEEX|nr:hemicentin-1 [Caerostris extrusa]